MIKEQDQIRATHITCSRLPDILESPINILNEMAFPQDSNAMDASAQAGLDHEYAVLKTFQRQTSSVLAIPQDGYYADLFGARRLATLIHPEKIQHPVSGEMVTWLAGTPDSALINDFAYLQDLFRINASLEGAPVQAKCRTWKKAREWGDSIVGEPPADTTLQVMGEIAVTKAALGTDCRYGFVVVLLGGPTDGDVRIYCVYLDEQTEQSILEVGRERWLAIQRKDVSAFPDTGDWGTYFKNAYPRETVERYDDPDGSLVVLYNELAAAKIEIAKLVAIEKGFETAIERKAPDAALFYSSDTSLGKKGLLFTNKKSKDGVEVDEKTVAIQAWQAGANALAAIKPLITPKKREAYDKIIAAFPTLKALRDANSTPKIGSRRFYIKGVPNGKANSDGD